MHTIHRSMSVYPDPNFAITALTTCLEEIKVWMQLNYLKPNKSKTKLLLLGTPTALRKSNNLNLFIDSDLVSPSSLVHNLGVIFDSQLTFDGHIKIVSKDVF